MALRPPFGSAAGTMSLCTTDGLNQAQPTETVEQGSLLCVCRTFHRIYTYTRTSGLLFLSDHAVRTMVFLASAVVPTSIKTIVIALA